MNTNPSNGVVRQVELVNVRGHAITMNTYDATGQPNGIVRLEPEKGVRVPKITNKTWPTEEWWEIEPGRFVPYKRFSEASVVFDMEEIEDVVYLTTAAVQQAAKDRRDLVMPTGIMHVDGMPEADGVASNE